MCSGLNWCLSVTKFKTKINGVSLGDLLKKSTREEGPHRLFHRQPSHSSGQAPGRGAGSPSSPRAPRGSTSPLRQRRKAEGTSPPAEGLRCERPAPHRGVDKPLPHGAKDRPHFKTIRFFFCNYSLYSFLKREPPSPVSSGKRLDRAAQPAGG